MKKSLVMHLYEVPRQSKILLPITDGVDEQKQMCTFLHVDGMYSAIITPNGSHVHLGRSTLVYKVKDHYELAE